MLFYLQHTAVGGLVGPNMKSGYDAAPRAAARHSEVAPEVAVLLPLPDYVSKSCTGT